MKALHISPGVVSTLVEASNDAHMIVVGSRGPHRFAKPGLGVVNSGLLHHAHCPVAIIHEPESPDHEIRADSPVLVGVDGSPGCEAATALAFERPPVAARRWWRCTPEATSASLSLAWTGGSTAGRATTC
jgi:Universal stress protein family